MAGEAVSYKADPLAWVTSTSSRHDTHRRKRSEAPVLLSHTSAVCRTGNPSVVARTAAAMQRVACGDQPTWRWNEPLKQSGSQWLRENVLRQPSADGFDRS